MSQKNYRKKWTTTLAAGIAALFIAIGAVEVAVASPMDLDPAVVLQQCTSKCSPAEAVCMINTNCRYSGCVNDSKGKPIPGKLADLQKSCQWLLTKCSDLCNAEYNHGTPIPTCSACESSYRKCATDLHSTASQCITAKATCGKQNCPSGASS